ncbi:hypothetical protein M0R19_07665 [Candidatus Pacearchaeota archaeon]|jgi:hypothetical protein|nr:hypothetical protein [bacterium]MCK9597036.1 hypothetical protein [Candidatus Pacearchaeota archaeon]
MENKLVGTCQSCGRDLFFQMVLPYMPVNAEDINNAIEKDDYSDFFMSDDLESGTINIYCFCGKAKVSEEDMKIIDNLGYDVNITTKGDN